MNVSETTWNRLKIELDECQLDLEKVEFSLYCLEYN